jgi:hypothetical protein
MAETILYFSMQVILSNSNEQLDSNLRIDDIIDETLNCRLLKMSDMLMFSLQPEILTYAIFFKVKLLEICIQSVICEFNCFLIVPSPTSSCFSIFPNDNPCFCNSLLCTLCSHKVSRSAKFLFSYNSISCWNLEKY